MMHVALQIVAKALFSIEIGDEADALAQATLTVLDHIVGRARTFGIVPEWLPTPGNLRYRRAMRRWRGRSMRRSAAAETSPPAPLPTREGGANHPEELAPLAGEGRGRTGQMPPTSSPC